MNTPEPSVTLGAQASDRARVYQAGRDLYVNANDTPFVPPVVIPLNHLGSMELGFFGRDTEVKELLAQLQAPPNEDIDSVLVVTGLGGIGKTELATRVVRLALKQDGFPGGAIAVDFRGYEASSDLHVYPHQLYSPALKALGVNEIDPIPENQGPQFHAELDRRAENGLPVLLLLDNVSDPKQVLSLIPRSITHRVVITSRNSIAPLLPGATNLRLRVLSDEGAAELIQSKSKREFSLSDLFDLASLCDRLPLALSITGAVLASDPDLSAVEFADELMKEEERLEGLQHENIAVRAAFQLSYARLSAFDAQAFRRIALTPSNDLSIDSAALLLDVQHLKAKRALRILLNSHLLESGNAPGRWIMHDLVRLYAREQAERFDSREARHAAQVRLLDYFARRSSHASEWINQRPAKQPAEGFLNRPAAMEWFAAEASSLVASVKVAADLDENDITTDLAVSVVTYLDNVADFTSCLSILFLGVEAGKRSGNDLSVAANYNNLGIVYTSMRRFRDAVRWLNKAVALFHSLGDRDQEARSLVNLSGALRMLLGVEASMEPLERAMRLRGENSENSGFALTNLGISLRESGHFQKAETVLRRALEMHRRKGSRNAEASTLTHLGTAIMQSAENERSARRLPEAVQHLEGALVAYRDVRDRSGEAMALLNYGNALHLSSDRQKALEAYRASLQIFRSTEDTHGQGLATGAIGMALATYGDVDVARPLLDEALRLLAQFREPDKKRVIANCLKSLK
ncbi:tetratricopeptide repeat protein [Streptomyces sp. CS7]|uniref:tetratricopeptide repeat protein n=1 Tax=Streptomyces sp. CS-7 TaxID=2906769 RepID=UPI0021B2CBFB|nr:tetratricopeptide repeat protein [Streptomyces sp. CS-7]MCT6778476.1 tetratricopeptide repeat protein [Streptomyces sp. CS-7]